MWLQLLDDQGRPLARHDTSAATSQALGGLGVPGLQAGRIAVHAGLAPAARGSVDAPALALLHRRFGVQRADRLRIGPDDGRWPLLRATLRRHRVRDALQLRVFVHGRGLFDLALPDGRRAQLLCEAGDWLAVPAGLPQAFDGGRQADFDVLRLAGAAAPAADGPASPGAGWHKLPPPDLDALPVQPVAVAEGA